MRLAIYPGSFDPITNGHLDVIHRACRLFDELIVAVALNDQKHTSTLFTVEERIAILKEASEGVAKVRVAKLNGLLVDFARKCGANAIVRGLRAVSDFEFEFQMALMNRKMEPDIETIFLMPKEEYTYLSSRIVKEIARLGGNVEQFVPPCAVKALAGKFRCFPAGTSLGAFCSSIWLRRTLKSSPSRARKRASGSSISGSSC